MSFRERLSDLREVAEDRTGYSLQPRERMERLEESDVERRATQKELDLLAYTALDYVSGRPQEMKATERRKLIQKARVAWMKDPQAGAAVDLMNDFVFGRGIPKPKAADREVQKALDEAFDDADNQLVLTSYQAQLAMGTDLSLQSNFFLLVFDDGEDGKVKLGILEHDTVEQVVRDPDNRLRILYYVAKHFRQEWDFERDQPKVDLVPEGREGRGEVQYFAHWRNVEDATKDAEDGVRDKPTLAPEGKTGSGKVFHVALNRTTEMAFGHPTMDRTLRWFSAYNAFMDARLDIIQAKAAFIMKRKVKGTKGQVEKLATQALSRRSALGAAAGEGPGDVGPRPGSILTENEEVSHEDFSLDTGAGAAQQDSQMIRAQVSAAERWPQCHDAATETLTSEGWMTLAELKSRRAEGSLPLVATYSTDRDQIEFQAAQRMTVDSYSGEMVRWRNPQGVDLLVTPNHRMYVQSGRGGWRVRAACEVPVAGVYVKVAARADGHRVEAFTLPIERESLDMDYADARANRAVALRREGLGYRAIGERVGRGVGWVEDVVAGEPSREDQRHSPIVTVIPMDAWVRFLGWYIAEGGAGGVCQQVSSPALDDVQAACRATGLPAIEHVNVGQRRVPMWRWEPAGGLRKPLRRWLHHNVGRGSAEKRVPEFVFSLAAEQRALLLDALLLGDGHEDGPGLNAFYTISARLADDVQRLAVLDGRRATIKPAGTYSSVRGDRQGWWVYVASGYSGRNRVRDASWRGLPPSKRVEYDGEVYCFTVPNGTVMTRRNGRVAITGNSYLGDATSANLATATSLELPVLKHVEARQELIESAVRFFLDRVIERAVETDRIAKELTPEEAAALGKAAPSQATTTTGGEPPSELTASHEDKREDEEATQRDLSYEFSMPSPLKRMMGDLVGAVQNIARTFDPNNTNVELSRVLLGVALGEGLELEDPQRAVEKIFPAGYMDPAMAAATPPPAGDEEEGEGFGEFTPVSGPPGADGRRHADPANPYGAPMRARPPEVAMQQAWVKLEELRHDQLPEDVQAFSGRRREQVEQAFEQEVMSLLPGADKSSNGRS